MAQNSSKTSKRALASEKKFRTTHGPGLPFPEVNIKKAKKLPALLRLALELAKKKR